MSKIFIVDRAYSSRGHTSLVGDYPELDEYTDKMKSHEQDPPLYDIWKKGGRPVLSEEMPSKYFLHSRKKNLADAFCIRSGIIVVSEKMKQIIERLDPDRHQFFPLDIFYRNRDPLDGRYFTLHITSSKPTIVLDQPAVQDKNFEGTKYRIFVSPNHTSNPIVVSENMVEDVNWWRDDFAKGTYFVSQKLLDEVKANKLIFFRTYATVLPKDQLITESPSLPETEPASMKKSGFFQTFKIFK